MPVTDNLKLHIGTDDEFYAENETVADWRKKINGRGTGTASDPYSDYQIIDQAFGQVIDLLEDVNTLLKQINND